MTTLTLEVPSHLYRQLNKEANRQDKSPQVIAQDMLAKQLAALKPSIEDEREKVHWILKEAGLLTELSPGLRRRAEASTATLDEVRTALDRAGVKSFSEIVLEQRKEKEW